MLTAYADWLYDHELIAWTLGVGLLVWCLLGIILAYFDRVLPTDDELHEEPTTHAVDMTPDERATFDAIVSSYQPRPIVDISAYRVQR